MGRGRVLIPGVQGNLIPQGELKDMDIMFQKLQQVSVQGNLIPQGELKVLEVRVKFVVAFCPRKSNSPRGIERAPPISHPLPGYNTSKEI